MTRVVALSKLGLLCNKPPWGEMVALDLKAGKILWRSTVGTSEDLAPLGLAFQWGTPLFNGVADHRRAASSSPARWTLICAPSMRRRATSCGRAGCRCPASPIP